MVNSNYNRKLRLVAIFTILISYTLLGYCCSAFQPQPQLHRPWRLARGNKLFIPKKTSNDLISSFHDAGYSQRGTGLYMFQEMMDVANSISKDDAEALAGPFFGGSLFPYIAFIYFLNVKENETPKGVTVGFASCLSFVFLTIPAAIAAKLLFDVSLADSDWLHGSAESLLTITNLVTVVAFRQALNAKSLGDEAPTPKSATSYTPMTLLVAGLTLLAGVTAAVPALADPLVHTPYLGAFMDLPKDMVTWGNPEPDNALTVATWIIHWSSLVEFLVAMGFCWRWADVSGNEKWKGVTWGLIPLHSSGITACTYHLFYNRIPLLVPLQAFLTFIGNTTAAYAAFRLAKSNGWEVPEQLGFLGMKNASFDLNEKSEISSLKATESPSLIGFEDLGDALAEDNDFTFLFKLFGGCALASYAIKYGELLVDFPFDANLLLGIAFIFIPTLLNSFKWYKRSIDPTFEGWF